MSDKNASTASATTRVVLDIPLILESVKNNPNIGLDDALGELDAGIKAMLELLPESQSVYYTKTMDSYLWVVEMLLSNILEIVKDYEVNIQIDTITEMGKVTNGNQATESITESGAVSSKLWGDARNDSGAE